MGPEAPGLKDVVLEIATRANDHLSTSREYIEDLRGKNKEMLKMAFPAFLTGVSARVYLNWLERVDFDPFVRQPRDWKLPYRMWRAQWKQQL